MRVVAIVLLLTAILPLAGADQSLAAGPLSITTTTTVYGDGCEGTNGGETREARVHVDDPRPNGGTKDVVAGSACNSYEDSYNDVESSYLYVYYWDFQFGQNGPSGGFAWYGGSTATSSWCGSYVSVGSVVEYLGCPAPDGSAPPRVPLMP